MPWTQAADASVYALWPPAPGSPTCDTTFSEDTAQLETLMRVPSRAELSLMITNQHAQDTSPTALLLPSNAPQLLLTQFMPPPALSWPCHFCTPIF